MEQVTIRVRWADMDAYRHVNNAVYLTYLEEARDRDVIVVSHVSPIKAALAWALAVGDEVGWRMFVRVASIARVAVSTAVTPPFASATCVATPSTTCLYASSSSTGRSVMADACSAVKGSTTVRR